MGNCGICVQSQEASASTNRTTLLSSSSSYEDIPRTFHRNRLTNLRTFPSYNLHALIDETLLIIRTVVDTDQEPPHAMLVLSRIANREDRWLEVVTALVERVPMNDPLGATVSALLLDECSLPSKELLQQLIKRLCSNNRAKIKQLQTIVDEHIQEMTRDSNNLQTDRCPIGEDRKVLTTSEKSTKRSTTTAKPVHISDDNLNQERNTLVILGCLAEKLVGPSSTSMLETIALEYLVDRVYLGIHAYNQLKSSDIVSNKYSSILKIILFALIAVEKFSQTSESKHILLQSLTINNTDQRKMNVLEYYEPWTTSSNCLKKQIGFYAQWLLDNVFILSYRRPSYETLDHRLINVILNDKDVSEYLKIGSDGLEARNDTVSFESVRCTFHVNSGAWYYEVLILTDGVMQIGWATKQSKFLNHEGYGIGDDQYSIAYDGCRNLIWYGAKSIPHTNPPWTAGDIVGCFIDLDAREVIFSLNGRALEPFRKLFSHTSTNDNYFAAASFMSYQHCRFNFGSIPFSYPPKQNSSFRAFNDHAYLPDHEKFILPKYKKLELLRTMVITEHDCILCVDQLASVQLKPCQHTGFCQECADKLELCPICRTSIKERSIISH